MVVSQPWGVGVRETARVGAGLGIGQMGELVKPADCKSAAYGIVGSSPTLPTKLLGPDCREVLPCVFRAG